MVVDKSTEYYLTHSMGLTKKQIKEMLPGEVDKHCEEIIRNRIDARGMVAPEEEDKN
ncbi:MAG: hypothetical protein FWD14_02000 [Treponema sp.]|nr:hypothetical protein [Treponema sp.]